MRETLSLKSDGGRVRQFSATASEDAGIFNGAPVVERDEIEACQDPDELSDWIDDYGAAVVRVETQLRFPDSMQGRDWFHRARGALILYRITLSRVERQLKKLGYHRMPRIEAVAPEE
jgi:hypothetical protein